MKNYKLFYVFFNCDANVAFFLIFTNCFALFFANNVNYFFSSLLAYFLHIFDNFARQNPL